MRIEVGRSAEDLCRNLILFDGDSRMIESMVRQILKQFAEGF
jgi:hypothetical protein